jgi:hypothetical protein
MPEVRWRAGAAPDDGATVRRQRAGRASKAERRRETDTSSRQFRGWSQVSGLPPQAHRPLSPPGRGGGPVVVVGVTTHRGGRESRPQGEGVQ